MGLFLKFAVTGWDGQAKDSQISFFMAELSGQSVTSSSGTSAFRSRSIGSVSA